MFLVYRNIVLVLRKTIKTKMLHGVVILVFVIFLNRLNIAMTDGKKNCVTSLK